MTDYTQTDSTREAITNIRKGSESYTKCLTEITLNSNESFKRMKKANPAAKIDDGVLIRADSRGEFFEVIDHFEGIADSEKRGMEILKIKGKSQETHTEDSRSAMGRGMSDVLFRNLNTPSLVGWRRNGRTFVYQAQWIKDPITREPVRTFVDQTDQTSPHFNPELIKKIEKLIPNTGTYIKFSWKQADEGESFPTLDEIKKSLGYYYELKNILSGNEFIYRVEYIDGQGNITNDTISFVKYDVTEIASMGKKTLKIKLRDEFHKRCKCWHEQSEHNSSGCNVCKKCNGYNNDYDISIISAKIFKSKTRLNKAGETQTQGVYFEGEHNQVYCLENLYDLDGKYIESIYYYVIVVLSADAKNYMMNMNSNEIGEQILSSDRHGFEHSKQNRLYHESRSILKPWIEQYLKNDSSIVIESENSLSDEFKKEFNKMMQEIMEMEDAKGTGDGDGNDDDKEKVDLLEFKSKSYSIIRNKKSKIYLLFNPEKFPIGAKVEWSSTNTSIKIFPTVKALPRSGNKIPLAIQCDSEKEQGTIFAHVKSKDGKVEKAETLIECVKERDIYVPQPSKYLEFFPKTVTTEILSKASVDLYAHPNQVAPGKKIEVSFVPDPGFSTLEDITITTPKKVTISSPNYNFDFLQEDSDVIPASLNYRKTEISFEGKQIGLTGTLIAKTGDGSDDFTTECKIIFKDPEGDEGGFLKDWAVQKLRGGHTAFVYQEGKCIANSEVAHVKTILSDSDATAKKRFKMFEETKLFVISEMMKLGFEQAMQKKYEDKHRTLKKENYTDPEIFAQILDEMRSWENTYGDQMMTNLGLRARNDVPDQMKDHNISVQLGSSIFSKYAISSYLKGEKEAFGNEQFSEPELQCPIKKSIFNFTFKENNFTVGVYNFADGTIAARLDSFTPGTLLEPLLRHVRDTVQIYKKPEKEIAGISKDWIYTPVDINVWDKNVVKKIHISANDNDVFKIPDSPDPLGKDIPIEDDDTWIYEGEPLILYALYDNVKDVNENSKRKGQLVSFVNPDNLLVIALNYVRLRIMRPLAVVDHLSKEIQKIDNRKCIKCGLDASTSKIVSDNFNPYFDDVHCAIQELCLDCERAS